MIFKLGYIMRTKYKTNNKENILKYIKSLNKSFCVKDLYELMINNNENIGLTTIYRYLDELCKKELLKKNVNDDNIVMYQYLEECNHDNHFNLQCRVCGKLYHVDCDCIKDICAHLNKKHNFIIDTKNILIPGVCDNCKGE